MSSKRSHFARMAELQRLYLLGIRYGCSGLSARTVSLMDAITRLERTIRRKLPKGQTLTGMIWEETINVIPVQWTTPVRYLDIPADMLVQMEGVDALIPARVAYYESDPPPIEHFYIDFKLPKI